MLSDCEPGVTLCLVTLYQRSSKTRHRSLPGLPRPCPTAPAPGAPPALHAQTLYSRAVIPCPRWPEKYFTFWPCMSGKIVWGDLMSLPEQVATEG